MSEDKEVAWARAEITATQARIAKRDMENAKDRQSLVDLNGFVRVRTARLASEAQQAAVVKAGETVAAFGGMLGTVAATISDAIDATKKGAKKRAILKSLTTVKTAQTGWIVGAIGMYGIDGATQENTSPQLSVYKAEGLVELSDDGWSITKKGRDYLAEKN